MKSDATSASTFRAIADPTRRALLDQLRTGEKSVSQLAEPFDMSQPAISQHLRVLRRAGLVAERRDGRLRLYRLAPEPLREIDDWIEHYRLFWPRKLRALGEYLDRRELKSERPEPER